MILLNMTTMIYHFSDSSRRRRLTLPKQKIYRSIFKINFENVIKWFVPKKESQKRVYR